MWSWRSESTAIAVLYNQRFKISVKIWWIFEKIICGKKLFILCPDEETGDGQFAVRSVSSEMMSGLGS